MNHFSGERSFLIGHIFNSYTHIYTHLKRDKMTMEKLVSDVLFVYGKPRDKEEISILAEIFLIANEGGIT